MSTRKNDKQDTFPNRMRQVVLHFHGKEWGGQAFLSKKTLIPTTTINAWLREDKPTSPETSAIKRISQELGISFEWLATGEGKMLPEPSGPVADPTPAGGAAWLKAIEKLEAALKARGLSKGIPEDRKALLAELLVQGQQAGTPAEVLQRQLDQLVDLLEDSIRKAHGGKIPNP